MVHILISCDNDSGVRLAYFYVRLRPESTVNCIGYPVQYINIPYIQYHVCTFILMVKFVYLFVGYVYAAVIFRRMSNS